ncbi:MAG: aspartate--tRNA ligase [Bacteroidota bacterium]
MTFKQRTHTCGELRSKDIGIESTLNGWVDRVRDLGGVLFIDLRDRYGKTQIVFNPQKCSGEVYELAKELRSEFVVSVSGLVDKRPEGTENLELPTGEVDIVVTELEILNRSLTPPFSISEEDGTNEETRLKYRYLDLRRDVVQKNLLMRHKMYQVTRNYFSENNFIEVETPVLMKSTPEGARDYLVPSRVHHGKFYALPQSPQTYKQILMVAGFDRYFQIVKCFRDEDLRADRQPEFTQIDVEISFPDEELVYKIVEGCMTRLYKEVLNVEIPTPFPRMSYHDAMEKYGSDKPDLRFDLQLTNVSDVVKDSPFRLFAENVAKGGAVAGLRIPNGNEIGRNQIDGYTDFMKKLGAGGLIWGRVVGAQIESPTEKHITQEYFQKIAKKMNCVDGDLILLASGNWSNTFSWLGTLRLEIARKRNLIDESQMKFLWVTEFPMFEFSEEEKRFVAMHHPFTSPSMQDVHLLDSEPNKARARAYDLVLNGNEIAGGSIRIHSSELQSKVFSLLGIGEEEAKRKFGFMLDAFKYGAPPHGGIAFGFDRIAMLMSGSKSIRDVIAFPKTTSAMSLMDEAPSEVDEKQLKELHIRVV